LIAPKLTTHLLKLQTSHLWHACSTIPTNGDRSIVTNCTPPHMYSAHSTLLHRLATASKPNNFNLWQWHERESHYSMQESSRATVCVKCVTEQCCGLLLLHSLRGTWMNEWVLRTGGKTLKRKPVPILLCQHKYTQIGPGTEPMQRQWHADNYQPHPQHSPIWNKNHLWDIIQ